MSWIEKLYETYESCSAVTESGLTPPFHMRNNTHLEIRITADGKYLDAKPEEIKNTIIPCTEKSEAARVNNPPPHPFCDKIQFVAKDYKGAKTSYFDKYYALLTQWADSEHSHPMVKAVHQYVKKGTLIADVSAVLREGEDPADLFVRWVVEVPGVNESKCWESKTLFRSWQEFYQSQDSLSDICMVSGKTLPIAINHPKKIRNSGDGGKLISSNDKTGFTFRGKFFTDEVEINGILEIVALQPLTVSSEVSQKAHRALNWLIGRQSFKNGDQVILSWAISGKETPDMFADTISLWDEPEEEVQEQGKRLSYEDARQSFGRKLSMKIAGYKTDLGRTDDIVVMGLDSAGPGRISITFYRELSGSEFLERIENWHVHMGWHFSCYYNKKNGKLVGGRFTTAPSPETVAAACYGTKRDEDFKKFRKSVCERLLPSIVDGRNVPVDLVQGAIKKASNRLAYKEKEHWQWEQALSVACSLYRCYSIRNTNQKIEYTMALENDRTDRDYLYGRLLAIAEHIEERALYLSKENRETNAARMMQMFAEHPFSTWKSLWERLNQAYLGRLQSNRPGFLFNMKNLIGEVNQLFQHGDFEDDRRLSGLYLLGYHCQRLELVKGDNQKKEENDIVNND